MSSAAERRKARILAGGSNRLAFLKGEVDQIPEPTLPTKSEEKQSAPEPVIEEVAPISQSGSNADESTKNVESVSTESLDKNVVQDDEEQKGATVTAEPAPEPIKTSASVVSESATTIAPESNRIEESVQSTLRQRKVKSEEATEVVPSKPVVSEGKRKKESREIQEADVKKPVSVNRVRLLQQAKKVEEITSSISAYLPVVLGILVACSFFVCGDVLLQGLGFGSPDRDARSTVVKVLGANVSISDDVTYSDSLDTTLEGEQVPSSDSAMLPTSAVQFACSVAWLPFPLIMLLSIFTRVAFVALNKKMEVRAKGHLPQSSGMGGLMNIASMFGSEEGGFNLQALLGQGGPMGGIQKYLGMGMKLLTYGKVAKGVMDDVRVAVFTLVIVASILKLVGTVFSL